MMIVLLLFQFVFAGEPDNMLARSRGSTAYLGNESIETVINGMLDQRLEAYNYRYKNKSCNRKLLYDSLTDTFDRNFPSIDDNLKAVTPPAGPKSASDLPYKGPLGIDNCASKTFSRIPYNSLSYSRSVKIKSKGKTFYVGFDKFEHFFAHGYNYWAMLNKDPHLPKEEVERALNWGIKQEDSIWGLKCYGVKSYGDLAANYQGLLFWSQLFDGPNPFVTCKNGQYKRVRNFKIDDFFDESMDESINCNSYENQEALDALKIVWKKEGIQCPALSNSCEGLRKKYPAFVAKKILHPRCLGTGNSQVEARGSMTLSESIDAVRALKNDLIPIPKREESGPQSAPEAVQ